MTTTYVFITAPEDKKIIASKGTLERQLVVTESLGFMCLDFTVTEVKKMRLLPFYRTRHIATFTDEREKALALLEEL